MHKIGLKVVLGWVLFLPITAYSLGLGDIDVKSFLNQPLNAEISVISERAGEIDDLLVALASRNAFARASLSRPSHLNDLKFSVVQSDDGASAVIKVKTQSAVKEPVLNFLVEADWSKGKVFREFTILLDPPYYAQQLSKTPPKVQATSQVAAEPVEKAINQPLKEVVKQAEPIVNQIAEEPDWAGIAIDNQGYVNDSAINDEYSYDISSSNSASIANEQAEPEQVKKPEEAIREQSIKVGDDNATLWSVAKTLKTDGVSMSQIMLALQRANKDAFGLDNINNLKQGSVLRVPNQNEMAQLSQKDAYVEVLNQGGLWNEYLEGIGHPSVNSSNTQANASDTANANEVSTTKAPKTELSIITEDKGFSDKAALRSDKNLEQVSKLRKQLLLSEEETESLKIERNELSDRVRALESEIEKRNELDNLALIEDNSLATLEQGLANNNVEEVQEQPIIDEVISESVIEDDVIPEDTEIVDDTNFIQPPVIVSESSNSDSFVDDIISVLTNPIFQASIAGILLLILLAAKFLKGRSAKEDEEGVLEEPIEDSFAEDNIDTESGLIIPSESEYDKTPISDDPENVEETQSLDDFSSTIASVEPLSEDGFSEVTSVIPADDMPEMDVSSDDVEEEEQEQEQDETLDEVDVYLAYSLFDNAEELLKEKLVSSPERADYKAKLLDTYFATKNKDAFNDEARSLKDLGSKASKYWPRVQTMGFELDPSNSMFAEGEGGDISKLAIAKPEMADFDVGVEEEIEEDTSSFDLSLKGDQTGFVLKENTELPDDIGQLDISSDADSNSIDSELDDIDNGLDFDLDVTDINSAEADVDLEISIDDIDSELDVDLNADTDDLLEIENAFDTIAIPALDDDAISVSEEEEDIALTSDDENVDLAAGLTELESDDDLTQLDLGESYFTELDSHEKLDVIEPDVLDDDLSELGLSADLTSDLDAIEEIDIIPPVEDDDELVIQADDDLVIAEDDEDIVISDDNENLVITEEVEELVIPDDSDDLVIEEDDGELVIPDVDIDLDFDIDDETDIANIEGLMLPDDVDEVATKLDLAKAFHDMGDSEGARSSLEEVIKEGSDEQKAEAQTLLDSLAE